MGGAMGEGQDCAIAGRAGVQITRVQEDERGVGQRVTHGVQTKNRSLKLSPQNSFRESDT